LYASPSRTASAGPDRSVPRFSAKPLDANSTDGSFGSFRDYTPHSTASSEVVVPIMGSGGNPSNGEVQQQPSALGFSSVSQVETAPVSKVEAKEPNAFGKQDEVSKAYKAKTLDEH